MVVGFRYKQPVGWKRDNYRHFLAAKYGFAGGKYYKRKIDRPYAYKVRTPEDSFRRMRATRMLQFKYGRADSVKKYDEYIQYRKLLSETNKAIRRREGELGKTPEREVVANHALRKLLMDSLAAKARLVGDEALAERFEDASKRETAAAAKMTPVDRDYFTALVLEAKISSIDGADYPIATQLAVAKTVVREKDAKTPADLRKVYEDVKGFGRSHNPLGKPSAARYAEGRMAKVPTVTQRTIKNEKGELVTVTVGDLELRSMIREEEAKLRELEQKPDIPKDILKAQQHSVNLLRSALRPNLVHEYARGEGQRRRKALEVLKREIESESNPGRKRQLEELFVKNSRKFRSDLRTLTRKLEQEDITPEEAKLRIAEIERLNEMVTAIRPEGRTGLQIEGRILGHSKKGPQKAGVKVGTDINLRLTKEGEVVTDAKGVEVSHERGTSTLKRGDVQVVKRGQVALGVVTDVGAETVRSGKNEDKKPNVLEGITVPVTPVTVARMKGKRTATTRGNMKLVTVKVLRDGKMVTEKRWVPRNTKIKSFRNALGEVVTDKTMVIDPSAPGSGADSPFIKIGAVPKKGNATFTVETRKGKGKAAQIVPLTKGSGAPVTGFFKPGKEESKPNPTEISLTKTQQRKVDYSTAMGFANVGKVVPQRYLKSLSSDQRQKVVARREKARKEIALKTKVAAERARVAAVTGRGGLQKAGWSDSDDAAALLEGARIDDRNRARKERAAAANKALRNRIIKEEAERGVLEFTKGEFEGKPDAPMTTLLPPFAPLGYSGPNLKPVPFTIKGGKVLPKKVRARDKNKGPFKTDIPKKGLWWRRQRPIGYNFESSIRHTTASQPAPRGAARDKVRKNTPGTTIVTTAMVRKYPGRGLQPRKEIGNKALAAIINAPRVKRVVFKKTRFTTDMPPFAKVNTKPAMTEEKRNAALIAAAKGSPSPIKRYKFK